MPCFNIENLIGWQDSDTNYFICDKCFLKRKDLKEKDFETVSEDELDGDHLFICDECGEKFR